MYAVAVVRTMSWSQWRWHIMIEMALSLLLSLSRLVHCRNYYHILAGYTWWCVYRTNSKAYFLSFYSITSAPLYFDTMWIEFPSKRGIYNLKLILLAANLVGCRIGISVAAAVTSHRSSSVSLSGLMLFNLYSSSTHTQRKRW